MGRNPFPALIESIRERINPRFPNYALGMLAGFVVFRVAFLITVVTILLLPIFRGHGSRKRHYFFVRRVESKEYRGMPYLVPNRCMVIVLGELLSSMMYLILACSNYRTLYSSFDLQQMILGALNFLTKTHTTPQPAFRWLPSYLGIWMAGWGLVHACFCHIDETSRPVPRWVLSPRVYNFIWISWSLVVTISIGFWSVKAGRGFDLMERRILHLFKIMDRDDRLWNVNHTTTSASLRPFFTEAVALFQALDQVSSTNTTVFSIWVAVTSVLAIFYLGTTRYLRRLLQKVLVLCDPDALALAPRDCFASTIWRALEAEFRYLSRFSVYLTISIVLQIGVFVLSAWASSRYQVATVKIAIALVDQAVGIFIAPLLLVQSWRIFTESYAADEAQFGRVQVDFHNQKIPYMASQLLGWDTTEHWGDRSAVNLANFPGLTEAHPTSSSHLNISLVPEGTKFNYSDKINVLRTTIVTKESMEMKST
ncbi:hypothetical protein CROQUDRAFT_659619 [Cronartium quercuum f. sp. fusiforme G11]|uniref:Uncharacterized protein n=1 Tax=Cronartium quercuum f. sp. fusiforme G11 TaxID=708437 RepID=A0A9P6TAJ3_9BASI|nr:hypothetical protein CROQUDRAFT_659619 [Cronartium quercuum f. sp. fusiforme G11]